MKKYFMVCFLSVFLLPTLCFAQNGRYIRKMAEPDFFIPTADKFNQPEKLPPVYRSGKKVTGDDKKTEPSAAEQAKPAYQQKYEQYHEDLKDVAVSGEVTPNEELKKALDSMQSGEVFEVKDAPSQATGVSNRFEKALEETLKQN